MGGPIGSGVNTSGGRTYFPPFPLLAYKGGSGSQLGIEVPIAGGDPALAYGKTRTAPGIPAGASVAYYASLVFSADNCENGGVVQRSFNDGGTWDRPGGPEPAP